MKKIYLGLVGSFLALTLGTCIGVSFDSHNVGEAQGYSTSSLPSTIDLNDTSAANIRSYYSSLNSLGTDQRQGTNLLKNLKTILKNGQKYYSYDSGNAIWQIYEIADRDWDKSPASSTTYGTYNSSTKKITNYTYGTSSSSSKNNPYIHALYINRDVTNQTTAWDDHNQDRWGINREHVWPKAEGFETSGAGGARGDPMHLMAGNGYANNIHSNYYYGYVKTSSSYTDCGNTYSNQSGNLRGSPVNASSGTVFEPQDCDKGDIARAIFYMVARYNYLSGSDSDGIDSNNPNLELTQNISDWASSGYSSTTIQTGKMGLLTDLLNWHHQDPVDQYEIHRNNLLYTNYTNNRNPFIDFPEWVDFIWGTAVYNGKTKSTYSSTPTGYATPSSDTINGYNSGGSDPVSVTGVTLEKESTSMEVGASEVLSYTITPSNATNQGVSWTSSNTNVATVSSSGRVEGVAEGSATITVRTSDGNFTDTCAVTVTAASGDDDDTTTAAVSIADYADANSWANGTKYTSVSLDTTATASVSVGGGNTGKYYTSGNEWRFYRSESAAIQVSVPDGYELDSVTFTFNVANNGVLLDSLSNQVASGSEVSLSGQSAVFTVANTNSATNGQVKFTSISVTYHSTGSSEVTLDSIAVKTAPTKTTYVAGESFDANGLVISATYSNSNVLDIPYEDNEDSFEFDPSDSLSTSDHSVTISYGGKSTTQAITVNASKTLSSISVSGQKTSFEVGDDFSFEGIVTATYSDSSTWNVTSSATFSGYDMDEAGDQTVTVSYTEGGLTKTTTYSISVSDSGGGSAVTDNTQYSLITSTSELVAGKSYLITNATTGTVKTMSNTTYGNNRPTTELTVSEGLLTRGSVAMSVTLGGSSGAWTFLTDNYTSTNGYLNASSSTNSNNLQVGSLNNYAYFSISFSGNAAVITCTGKSSRNIIQCNTSGTPISCYTSGQNPVYLWKEVAPKTLDSITLNTENVKTSYSVGDTFSSEGLVVTANYEDGTHAIVTPTSVSSPNMSTTGQKTVTVTYEENNVSKSAQYNITVNSNPTLTWTAPTINTYSGTSLTSTMANSWGVTYNNGSGSIINPTYGQFSVKLGGTTISLPYTWQAGDDGKALAVSYSSLTTNTTTVSIVQSLQAVNKEVPGESTTSDLTFTAACGGSGTADDGKGWTVTSDGTESSFDTQNGKGIHYGTSSAAVQYIKLTSTAFSGTITRVVVQASTASGVSATVSVKVGGAAFGGNAQSLTTSNASYTFNGEATGTIEVLITKPSRATKAIYCKGVAVTYATSGSSINIANVDGHEDAQRAVVKFAKAFNTAMDTTSSCTTNMSSAWSSATSAWNTFLSDAAALGSTEEAYAKDLVKYATAQWTEDTDEDYSYCLERCLATYEKCVTAHGQTAFMSDVRTAPNAAPISPISINNVSTPTLIIIIVSVIALSAVGGYFYIRRKKEI